MGSDLIGGMYIRGQMETHPSTPVGSASGDREVTEPKNWFVDVTAPMVTFKVTTSFKKKFLNGQKRNRPVSVKMGPLLLELSSYVIENVPSCWWLVDDRPEL
jgi:hypothetical protein